MKRMKLLPLRPLRKIMILCLVMIGPMVIPLFCTFNNFQANFFFIQPLLMEERIYAGYNFSMVGKAFGEIPFLYTNFLSKKQFEGLLVKSVPTLIRKDFSKVLVHTLHLAEKHRVDPFWVLAIMWAESRYRSSSRSSLGAKGLMQIMPETMDHIILMREKFTFLPGDRCGVNFNSSLDVEMGIVYLKYLLLEFKNDSKLATVAYNMGPNWIKKRMAQNLPVGEKNRYLDKVKEAYQILSLNFEYL